MSPDSNPDQSEPSAARIERDGESIGLSSPFSIGRSSHCTHAIIETAVSRRHALIQFIDSEGRWVVSDLGSSNGTYLNGVKIHHPEALKDGDGIRIGDHAYTFHEEESRASLVDGLSRLGATLLKTEAIQCWLLIADVKGFTRLSQEIPQQDLSARVRQWAGECETIVGDAGGLVNEYMGDSLMAFWKDGAEVASRVGDALQAFDWLQSESGLEFRVVVHYGVVEVGGGVSSGLEKLAGQELNFAYRMEKAAGQGDRKISLTRAATDRLRSEVCTELIDDYEIKSFPGRHALYAPLFE